MQTSEVTEKLIEECAALNVRLIKNLPFDIQPLIWSSPTAVRNPETSVIFQPVHNNKNIFARLFRYTFILGSAFIRGLYRLLRHRGVYYCHIKNDSSILLIVPSVITERTGEFKTNYLTEEEGYSVDKLVFSYSRKTLESGKHFSAVSFFNRIRILFRLLSAVFCDFIKQLACKKISLRYIDALVILTQWILSHSWYLTCNFYHLVNSFADSNSYESFLLLHEMHFYSRIVWHIAREKKIVGITAQHGLIVPEKLWYFPDKAEIQVECPLPDVFFVYSLETEELLRGLYPETNFFTCCSPRFKRWKSYSDIPKNDVTQNGKPICLFANNAAIIHDVVVLKALRELVKLKLKDSFTLRLRLHPTERLNLKDQLWVWSAAALKKIEISSKSLQDDFQDAGLVIGAASTVVQEAFLVGLPVMGVFHKDFVASSLLPSEFRCAIGELSEETLNRYMNKEPDKDLVEHCKVNLGVFSPGLTTKLIYDCYNETK
ncbi:MAG: hypothetical protein FVQ80_00500 [Planctomycetes bacterium]|nr:hypothetical protein [Planctomycetota bacterium]